MTSLMTVGNNGPLLDRMGADCDDLQFVRELTQNSIDAIQKAFRHGVLKPGDVGQIIWDVDWMASDAGEPRLLCVTDNGIGMTGPELVANINQLCPRSGVQSLTGNFGIGARISAATRNQAGVLYLSWHNGEGSMAELWRDPEKDGYGLKDQRVGGLLREYAPVADSVKPDTISTHGTRVVLRGKYAGVETALPPPGIDNERWLLQSLNNRYFRLPENIVIRVNETLGAKPKRSALRPVRPMSLYLSDNSDASGVVAIPGAKVHWWVLKEKTKVTKDGRTVQDMWAYNHVQASSGHVAALYQNELYELRKGRQGQQMVQGFGLLYGHARAVIYVEPERAISNAARTALLLPEEIDRGLPWSEYQAAFRERMPEQLKALDDAAAHKMCEKGDSDVIEKRIKTIISLFQVTRFEPAEDGDPIADDSPSGPCGKPAEGPGPSGQGPRRKPRPKPGGDFYRNNIKNDGVPARPFSPENIPKVVWVTGQPLLKDKAAAWHPERWEIHANADFRVLTDVVRFCVREWSLPANAEVECRKEIRSWFEQTLIESVMGIESLRDTSDEWGAKACEAALSTEALTAAVMARYNMIGAAKQRLAGKGVRTRA